MALFNLATRPAASAFVIFSLVAVSVSWSGHVADATEIYSLTIDSGLSNSATTVADVSGSSVPDLTLTETFDSTWEYSNQMTGGSLRIEDSFDPRNDINTAAFFAKGYFELAVSADAGKKLDLTSFELDAQRATTNTSQRGIEIYASTNGSAFTFNTSSNTVDQTLLLDEDFIPTNRSDGPTHYDLDLTAAEFQGIDSVTFRIYSTRDGGVSVEIGEFAVNGEVRISAIPEPSALTLTALCLLGLIGRGCRRRRRRT